MVMGIAQSLVETVRRRERDHAEEREQFQQERAVQGELLRRQNSRLEYMEARIQDHRPTKECPEGFTLNRDRRATSFVIPIQDNLFEPAHWVKQLAVLRPSCYRGAMRPLMPTFTSLLPYLYDRAAHSRLPDSPRT